jgi:O-antigen ligase
LTLLQTARRGPAPPGEATLQFGLGPAPFIAAALLLWFAGHAIVGFFHQPHDTYLIFRQSALGAYAIIFVYTFIFFGNQTRFVKQAAITAVAIAIVCAALDIAGFLDPKPGGGGQYPNEHLFGQQTLPLGILALGLFVALPRKRSRNAILLGAAVAGICGALLLSVTRASWLSFLLSGILIAILGLSRRALIVIAACAIPVVLAGLFVLHQKRNVGFFDQKDDSIAWRQKIWREGFHLLTSNPRHLAVGVGMDSIKSHWREWDLFEGGKLPMGHMHSDYLEFALERGVPTLIAWLILLGAYGWTLWKTQRRVAKENWIERGIVLGALGGLLGFMTSGVVHYNWGDSEVVMIFYLIMGLSLVVERSVRTGSGSDRIK